MISKRRIQKSIRSCPNLFLAIGLAGVLLWGFSFAGASAGHANERVVTVGVYENAPKIFTDADGQPSGIFIDILEYIAKQENWRLEYRTGTWAEGLKRLGSGEIDLMPDVAYSDQRAKHYAFHDTQVLSSWFQAYAHKGSGISSVLDLNGKRVAVLAGSVQHDAFERFSRGFGLDISIVFAPDFKTMFEMTARGEADVAVTNQFYGAMHARKHRLEDTAIVFEPSALFFAAPKNQNREILAAIDRHLAELKKDPQSVYYASLKKRTSEEVRFRLPDWVKIAGLAVLAILALSLLGSILLKRQVNARTRELSAINRDMELRIEERTRELAQAMEKAQESDRLKSAFLATMSHELRTPLNSIIGFTGILIQRLVGPLSDEQDKQLHMVYDSAKHLLELINDVLDISKIEAGQLSVSSEPFNLKNAVDKVVQSARPLADKKGLSLESDITSDLGEILSDQRRVEQILLNLLSNAIKFTEQGSVRVTARLKEGQTMISVIDTGIGIKPEDMGILFNAFRQIETGLTRKYEGTGLGLSISKKLASLLGGDIEVESQWGKGSTFRLILPRQEKTP